MWSVGTATRKDHRVGLCAYPDRLRRRDHSLPDAGGQLRGLSGGKIRRESDYWDAATFMKQVGLLP